MNNLIGFIYCAFNTKNGKFYVGQCNRTLGARIAEHKSNAFNKRLDTYFYNALRKHGMELFTWHILTNVYKEHPIWGPKTLDELETYWQKEFRSAERAFGYNTILGAVSGGKRPPSTIQKIKAKRALQAPHTPERIAKQAAAISGEKNFWFGKTGEACPFFGKPKSPEQRAKMSAAAKGKPKSEAHKASLSALY